MQLAPWLRDRLWRADRWPAALAELREGEPRRDGPEHAARAWQLACAIEHCVPDRSRAVAAFVDAWRAGHPEARERALGLARSLRAHVTIAELCATDDPAACGAAYVDAGLLGAAIDPLQRALAAGATASLPRAQLTSLLALATGARFDPAAELATALATAAGLRGADAAPWFVHAARIARAAVRERLASILVLARRACPNDASIDALVVEDLLDRGATEELLDHYRASFLAARTRRDYVERMRAAACELYARDQRGIALRLLRLALETTYDELLPEPASHIAAWELLVAHAREQRSLADLVPLLLRALAAPLSPDDAVYLARLGLEIAWREARDPIAAQPYAATLLDFLPDQPLAVAFVREAQLDGALPELPTIHITSPRIATTGRVPVIKAVPPVIAPAYGDDRRVVPALAPRPAASALRKSGRLALLDPPPPRTTTLRRDVSPVPAPPAPPRARSATTPRAPRVVVPIDVVIELASGAFFSTVLRDLSTSGAFVVTRRKLELGAILGLELQLPVAGSPAQQAAHAVNAAIARQTELGYGIQFVAPASELVDAIRALTS